VATVTGTRSTLSDTVGIAVDMSPTIQLIDPYDVGLLSYFGLSSLDKEATETTHQWMEDTLRPLTSLVTDNPLLIGATTINVAAGTGANFRTQDIVKIDDELIRITADPAADALTTVASPERPRLGWLDGRRPQPRFRHRDRVGRLPRRQRHPGIARTVVKTSKSNFTQIFEDVGPGELDARGDRAVEPGLRVRPPAVQDDEDRDHPHGQDVHLRQAVHPAPRPCRARWAGSATSSRPT
jgi:hypothetical protein